MLISMREYFKGKGQGIVEYALLLAFVVAIAVYALQESGLGGAIKTNFNWPPVYRRPIPNFYDNFALKTIV